MIVHLPLLDGLICKLTNVKTCVVSELKQIMFPKKHKWKRICRVKKTILLRSNKTKLKCLGHSLGKNRKYLLEIKAVVTLGLCFTYQ